MSLPIAVQVYSVREDAMADFRGTMEKIKAMGYDGVELAALSAYGITPVEAKKILDEVGLELVSAHIPVKELEQDEVLDAYAATGIKYVAVPWLKVEPTEEHVAACIARIKAIGERCKARGIQLVYHNHEFELDIVNGKHILDTYYEEIPSDLLQTEIDTCWVKIGGEDPAEYIRKYTGKSPIVHLKDFVGQKTKNMYALIGTDTHKEEAQQQFEFRPVGYGCLDMAEIVKASEEAGAAWLVVEQDRPSLDKTPLESIEMSVKYLKENIMK